VLIKLKEIKMEIKFKRHNSEGHTLYELVEPKGYEQVVEIHNDTKRKDRLGYGCWLVTDINDDREEFKTLREAKEHLLMRLGLNQFMK
jgi:hypothetical protein